MKDSKTRFSNRVEQYVRFRPSYPPTLIDVLVSRCGLDLAPVVADVGSGTGLLTELFLKRGFRVIGVEPNREMREAGEALLSEYPRFQSVDATAEATTLPDASVDLVTAGQAFHWFDRLAARAEFQRVLKPKRCAVLVWNLRAIDASPFMAEYEQLLRDFGTDYEQVSHHGVYPRDVDEFFGEGHYEIESLPNEQIFDYEGLEGRLLSSSYVPASGEPNHDQMLAALGALFDEHQENGVVRFVYETKCYIGTFDQR